MHGHWPSLVGPLKVVNASIFSQRDAAARATLTDTVLYRYGNQPLRRSPLPFYAAPWSSANEGRGEGKKSNKQWREAATKHKKKEWREEKRNEKGSED